MVELLNGAVVMDEEDPAREVVAVLSTAMNTGKIADFTYFMFPHELNWDVNFDFIIVSHWETLKALIKGYDKHQQVCPHVIYLIHPSEADVVDFDSLNASLEITAINHGEIDGRSTLQFDSFYQTLDQLRNNKK